MKTVFISMRNHVSMADTLLAKIYEAKSYIDKAVSVLGYVTDHQRDEYFMEALLAVEDTATDLSYEAWSIKMSIWEAQGRIPSFPEPSIPSFTGTRKIPVVR